MTATPATAEPAAERPLVRTRPTAALLRAAVVGCAAITLAVLAGKPVLILAGLPLLAWALVAVARRVMRGEELGVPLPRIHAGRRTIEEGASTSVTVTSAPDTLLAATVPLAPHADFAPRYGAAAGDASVRLRLSAQRWGRVHVGPVHVLVTDPLGAFRAQEQLPPLDVRVVPSSTVLDAPIEVPTPIGVSGVHLSRRRGDGTALSEVRTFRPGDRLHRINWRVSQRTGELHTNATFTEHDTEVLIVTDTISDIAPAPWADDDAPTSLDMTIRATSAVARHYLTAGDRVSVFDIGHLIGPVRAGTGPRQLRVLTDALARASRDDQQTRPMRRLRAVRPGTLTVVCSPLLHPEVITQIGEMVAHGADVIVVDTLPPSIGDVSVLQGKPLRRDGRISDRFWPEAWATRRLLRRTTVRELREAGVPVTAWEGPSSLAPVLQSLSVARSAPRMRRS
ncbi:DUF58 domain-containing protein [Brachybacterium alimentarium]|uniref:DUF58 domain-containing protein n=1 Tax=Brachybacterium alimentarium TaxID=47845 RepID=UPI000DF431D1|nr:DUF58 domain-containing protein [Brachybacterium alimentarium]RCS69404.1 DUF58 domain-containing protein [Brachybacterium alimentarium]